jgi:hypothetical protein
MPVGTAYPSTAQAVLPQLPAKFSLGNRKKNPVRTALTQTAANMQGQVDQLAGMRPQDTAFYQAGRGQLLDFLRQQTRGDARMAATRGLAGSELELAQATRRQTTAAGQQRELLAGSEQNLEQQRQAALQRLLQSLGLWSGFATNQRQISSQNRAAWMQGLGQIIGTAVQPGPQAGA